MGSTWNPDTGKWTDDTPSPRDEFDKSRWHPGDSEIGNRQPTHREYDPGDYGPDVGLQIIPVTPTREEDRKDRWRPEYGNVDEIIKRNRLPSITPDKKPIVH